MLEDCDILMLPKIGNLEKIINGYTKRWITILLQGDYIIKFRYKLHSTYWYPSKGWIDTADPFFTFNEDIVDKLQIQLCLSTSELPLDYIHAEKLQGLNRLRY